MSLYTQNKDLQAGYMHGEEKHAHEKYVMTLPPSEERSRFKLVALDLDGTSLQEDKTFTEHLINTVHRLQDRGIYFAICSGRAPESVKNFADMLHLDSSHGYCICFNGGSLINLKNIEEDLHISTLKAQDLIDIEALAVKCGCVVHAYSTRRILLTESDIEFTQMEIASCMQPYECIKFPEEVDPAEEAYKLIVVGDAAKLDNVRASCPPEFLTRFNIARTHPNFLEFMTAGCSKGSTLKKLCKLLHLDLSQTVAFGDAENDIEMIKAAGAGVAMGNAMETLKKVAPYSALHYADDGVAVYLDALFGKD